MALTNRWVRKQRAGRGLVHGNLGSKCCVLFRTQGSQCTRSRSLKLLQLRGHHDADREQDKRNQARCACSSLDLLVVWSETIRSLTLHVCNPHPPPIPPFPLTVVPPATSNPTASLTPSLRAYLPSQGSSGCESRSAAAQSTQEEHCRNESMRVWAPKALLGGSPWMLSSIHGAASTFSLHSRTVCVGCWCRLHGRLSDLRVQDPYAVMRAASQSWVICVLAIPVCALFFCAFIARPPSLDLLSLLPCRSLITQNAE